MKYKMMIESFDESGNDRVTVDTDAITREELIELFENMLGVLGFVKPEEEDQ